MLRNGIGTHRDAYVRLTADQLIPLHSRAPEEPGSLVYVDIDVAGDRRLDEIAWLQKLIVQVPAGFFLQASTVLLRWPRHQLEPGDLITIRDQADGLSDFLTNRGSLRPSVGFVSFQTGREPIILWSSHDGSMDPDHEARLLAQARAIELWQLLQWGKGIWRPSGYHYSLPSGEHSNTFLRLANAIQRPRDARALATWLFRHVQEDLAFVTDTPTLTTLVIALQEHMQAEGYTRGDTVTLADYPANSFEAEQAIEGIKAASKVLGLVSVSSTGSTVLRIRRALEHAGTEHVLESIVSRTAPTATMITPSSTSLQPGPWLGVTEGTRSYPSAEQCDLCRDPRDGRIVFIDPTNFETLGLSMPTLITPEFRFADRNRAIWEAFDDIQRVGVNAIPHETTRQLRNRDRLAVRCYPNDLLNPALYSSDDAYQRFLEAVAKRVRQCADEITKAEDKRALTSPRFDLATCDLVVTTETDANEPGFDRFLEKMREALEQAPWLPERIVRLNAKDPELDLLKEQLGGTTGILVVSLGSITGTTMQRLLVAVHDAISETPEATQPAVGGLLLHARPERDREWDVLRNAFTRLEALWLTPLPLSSPFEEELNLLGLMEPKDPSAQRFLDLRRRCLSQEPEWTNRLSSSTSTLDPYAIFWGMPLEKSVGMTEWPGQEAPRLRPGSRFGYRLRAPATFAAVASAMQEKRLRSEEKSASVWTKFEMPAILRSYFDPPIIASVLRWLEPHEAWWGERPDEAVNVLAEVINRAPESDLKILLPEFLLAAIAGKVPIAGRDFLRSEAQSFVYQARNGMPTQEGTQPWSEEEIAPLLLALEVLEEDGDIRTTTERLEGHADRLKETLEHLDIKPGSHEPAIQELRDLDAFLSRSLAKLELHSSGERSEENE